MDKQGTFDLIGDIHGQAEKLEQLLAVLGYDKVQGVYRHPTNQAVFVGDFIDRGPNNCRVIEIVRAMVEQGHALAVMGNHEFNAICYHTPHPTKPGEWLRPHKDENNKQHQAVLDEYKEKKEELAEAIAWFKTLPLFLELDGLRVIHACWNQPAIDRLRPRLGPGDTLTEDLFVDASEKGSAAHNDIELLLKGPEFPLPEGHSFKDKDGHVRHAIRIAWWGGQPANWGAMALHAEHVPSELREKPIPASAFDFYPSEAPPVFIGHYWLHGSPRTLSANVACLDYSAGTHGPLMAYRWHGPVLYGENFISVEHGPFSRPYLDAAHKHCCNVQELLAGRIVGCFHCLSVMPVGELTNPNGPEWCPRCYMDSLIGDESGLPLTRTFLRRMRQAFFHLDDDLAIEPGEARMESDEEQWSMTKEEYLDAMDATVRDPEALQKAIAARKARAGEHEKRVQAINEKVKAEQAERERQKRELKDK